MRESGKYIHLSIYKYMQRKVNKKEKKNLKHHITSQIGTPPLPSYIPFSLKL